MKGESRLATSSVNDNGVFEVSFEGSVSAEDVRKAIRNQWSMGFALLELLLALWIWG